LLDRFVVGGEDREADEHALPDHEAGSCLVETWPATVRIEEHNVEDAIHRRRESVTHSIAVAVHLPRHDLAPDLLVLALVYMKPNRLRAPEVVRAALNGQDLDVRASRRDRIEHLLRWSPPSSRNCLSDRPCLQQDHATASGRGVASLIIGLAVAALRFSGHARRGFAASRIVRARTLTGGLGEDRQVGVSRKLGRAAELPSVPAEVSSPG
jgi:hypothetical protein